MTTDTDSRFILQTLTSLLRCDSTNPAFPGPDGKPGRGEVAVAKVTAHILEKMGLEVQLHEAAPGRTSVVGVLKGCAGGRSLMLNAHLDTVGPGGMDAPFEPHLEEGRLYGRGAYDMKGSVAACIAAARALLRSDRRLDGDLILAFVADEEDASLGMRNVLEHHCADGAVVTEPTELRLCLAHKGFTWLRLTTEGFACHGSDYTRGVDANLRMGRVLAKLSGLEAELRSRPPHERVGPPSLHAPLLQGGVGPSVYSPRCTLQLERRTIPGETPESVMAEVRKVLEKITDSELGELIPRDAICLEELLSRPPFEAEADSQVAECVKEAVRAVSRRPVGEGADKAGSSSTGEAPRDMSEEGPEIIGVPFWTDAALIQAAGIDTVVFGPAGDGAHQDVEWVDLESVYTCAQVLAETAVRYCGG